MAVGGEHRLGAITDDVEIVRIGTGLKLLNT